MIRDRVIRWLGGIVPDPMATPACQHSWSNWSDPVVKTITGIGCDGHAAEGAYAMQERRCFKCNQCEWRQP